MVTLLLATLVASASPCTAPKITSAHVAGMTQDGNLNRYRVAMTMTNVSSHAQPSNTLQFVDIFYGGAKLDAIGVPPLKPNGSYTAYYTFKRSNDAGENTTHLHVKMDMRQPSCSVDPAQTVTF